MDEGAPVGGGTDDDERPLVDSDALAAFEGRFDPARPEADADVSVVGYGEISMVFRLASHPGVVVKRLAGFRGAGEVDAYAAVVAEYVAALRALGVRALRTEVTGVVRAPGRHVVYLTQPLLDGERLGNAVLRDGDDDAFADLLGRVVGAVGAVARASREGQALGLDAQISNWATAEDGGPPTYLDVSTPFLRRHGREVLDLGPILRAAPLGLGRMLALTGKAESMVDRYYAPRLVLMDILGNFIKEGRPDRLAPGLELVNGWLADEGAFLGAAPLGEREIRADYAKDARMWAILQSLKRPDRFLRRTVLRRPYDYALMPRVERGLR